MATNHSAYQDWKEWRRLRALALKQDGWRQRAIAEALGVSEPAVSQWLAATRRGGVDALRTHAAPGPLPRLTPEQKRQIPEFLWHGPEAYGFHGQVWTCARIAKVIEEELGVRYDKGHRGRPRTEPLAVHTDDQGVTQITLDVLPGNRLVGVDPNNSGYQVEPLRVVPTQVSPGQSSDRPGHKVRVRVEAGVTEAAGPAPPGPEAVNEAAGVPYHKTPVLWKAANHSDSERGEVSGHLGAPW